jgi:protein SCO1/2
MRYILFFLTSIFFFACGDTPDTPVKDLKIIKKEALSILGNRDVDANGDTIYPTIPDFAFINQNGDTVTNEDFAGKAYVVDFFFIHCPTICPKVTRQMLRVHDKFIDNDKIKFMAHTIDPKRDDVAALKSYADKLDAKAPKWHFVTGDKDEIYEIADDYFSVAVENPDAPGGFDHSGRLILVDENRHVRAFANGTDPDEVTQFIADIEVLLAEK